MIWSDWLQHAAGAMGTTTLEAGFILSLVFISGIIAGTLIVSKGKRAGETIPTIGLIGVILFTYMAWIPLWTGSVIALIISLFLAAKISKTVSG